MTKLLVSVAGLLVCAGCAISGYLHGGMGLAAFALGLGVGVVGVLGLAALTKLLATLASERGAERRGVALTLLVFAVKIPVIVAIAGLIQRFEIGAIGCFSAAILLVYSVLVVGAATAKAGSD